MLRGTYVGLCRNGYLADLGRSLHSTGDLGLILGFGQEVQSSIKEVDLLPGCANDSTGFGSIGIRFYPPVSFYTLAVMAMLTGGWYEAVWIYLLIWSIAGAWGIYLLVREAGTSIQGLAAGLIYAITPFHLAEIFQFSLYAQFAAGAFFSFSLLFVIRVCRYKRWADVILCLFASPD